jgi:hypothetical protein
MSLLDQEASKRFLNYISSVWFNPEIERLKQIGSVADDYQPKAMEVILPLMAAIIAFFLMRM